MNARTTTLIGAAGLLLGMLLPWATITAPFVGTVTVAGYQGDGVITGGIGLLLLIGALVYKGKSGKMYSIASALLGLAAAAVAAPKIVTVGSALAGQSSVIGGVGVGVYVTVIGGVIALVGGLMRMPAVAAASGMPAFSVAETPPQK